MNIAMIINIHIHIHETITIHEYTNKQLYKLIHNTHIYVCMYVYVCCIHIYIYIYIHIHIQLYTHAIATEWDRMGVSRWQSAECAQNRMGVSRWQPEEWAQDRPAPRNRRNTGRKKDPKT